MLEIIINIYFSGVIGTLILFAAGQIGIYTAKRKRNRRSIFKIIL